MILVIGFAQKLNPKLREAADTGSADALVRNAPRARPKKTGAGIVRAARSVRARAPALPVF